MGAVPDMDFEKGITGLVQGFAECHSGMLGWCSLWIGVFAALHVGRRTSDISELDLIRDLFTATNYHWGLNKY